VQLLPADETRRRSRAEHIAETRRRIVEAAVDLHTSVGPPRTTVSAVAERAGVQRHTVYAHFPELADLFAACSGLWAARNPFPDVARWAGIGDPFERVTVALEETYAYWERTDADLAVLLPGSERLPEMAEPLRRWREGLREAAEVLAAGRPAGGRAGTRVRAALLHALQIDTWRSLVLLGGLTRAEAVEMMAAFVEAAGDPPAAS